MLFMLLFYELLSVIVFLNMYNVVWIIFGVVLGVYIEIVYYNLNELKCKDIFEK